jgi:arylamine N-acetyltransferase
MIVSSILSTMGLSALDAPVVRRIHDAPWLTIRDPELLGRFCARFGIDLQSSRSALINQVAAAFACLPFENLTKIIKADSVTSPSSAMRYPDEVIGDFLRWGTGGTCFSLAASMAAVFDAMGIEAYPVLADRHYGPDTHCGIMLVQGGGEVLVCDPGYLLFAPVKVPREEPVTFDNGFNRVELRPVHGGSRIELYTVVKGNSKLRLTFKLEPIADDAFGRAWERSFAFEMMSYPVLTRTENGCHQYLQANVLAVRNSQRTQRTILTRDKQIEFFTASAGIDNGIVTRALEIVNYGLHSAAAGC